LKLSLNDDGELMLKDLISQLLITIIHLNLTEP